MFLALWERVFAGFVLTDDLVLNTIFAGFGRRHFAGHHHPCRCFHRRHGHPSAGAQQVVPPAGVGDHAGVRPAHPLALQAAFSPLQQCLYGIVLVIVYTIVLDKVLIFGTTRTEVKIISQHTPTKFARPSSPSWTAA